MFDGVLNVALEYDYYKKKKWITNSSRIHFRVALTDQIILLCLYEMLCAIWYHLYNL